MKRGFKKRRRRKNLSWKQTEFNVFFHVFVDLSSLIHYDIEKYYDYLFKTFYWSLLRFRLEYIILTVVKISKENGKKVKDLSIPATRFEQNYNFQNILLGIKQIKKQ